VTAAASTAIPAASRTGIPPVASADAVIAPIIANSPCAKLMIPVT
jgi:hypothetical protein